MLTGVLRKSFSVVTIVGITVGAVANLSGNAFAASAGMACHLVGKPEMRIGNGSWDRLRVMQKLNAGDAVRCGTGSKAVIVLFKSGERFEIGAGGTGVVQANSVGGARSLGKLAGPSERVARKLSGSRSGAIMPRRESAPITLTPEAPGWIVDTERLVEWKPEKSIHYSFALFNRDSVVWTQKVSEPRVQLPPTLELQQREPYVWRVVAFDKSKLTGLPTERTAHWGVITFLSPADAKQLSEDVKPLDELIKENKEDDTTAAALLAELYREYGVLQKTISLLEDVPLLGSPGSLEAANEAYSQLGYYGLLFGRKEDVSSSFAPGAE